MMPQRHRTAPIDTAILTMHLSGFCMNLTANRLFVYFCYGSGVGSALVLPTVNFEAMNKHLAEIGKCVSAGAIALLAVDGAGWPEVASHLRSHGVTAMETYRLGTRLGMIMDTGNARFDIERLRAAEASNPKLVAWEALMWRFQEPAPCADWHKMDASS